MYTLDNLRTTIACKEQVLKSKKELCTILLTENKLKDEKDLDNDKSVAGIKLKVSYWENKVEIVRLEDEISVNKLVLADKENAENAQKAIELQYAPIVKEKESWEKLFEAVKKVLQKKNLDKSFVKQLTDSTKDAVAAANHGNLQQKIAQYCRLEQAVKSVMPEIIL